MSSVVHKFTPRLSQTEIAMRKTEAEAERRGISPQQWINEQLDDALAKLTAMNDEYESREGERKS